jgi:hypothetical protein
MKPKSQSNDLENLAMIAVGFALLIVGALISHHFIVTIDSGAAYIFVAFFPLPMMVFGLIAIFRGFSQAGKAVDSCSSVNDNLELDEHTTNLSAPEITIPQNEETVYIPKDNGSSFGSTLAQPFIVFGIIIGILIALGSIYFDVSKGITHSCGRYRSSCTDVFLKDSPTHFYITLAFNTLKALVFPILLAIFLKYFRGSKE